MTDRQVARLLTFTTLAFMGGFVVLYVDKMWPAVRAVAKAVA